MLDGELQESAGLLNEQIDLRCRPQEGDRCSVWEDIYHMTFMFTHTSHRRIDISIHLFFSTSSTGTFRMGVPLISRIRSPTCIEFFTSGLIHSESTLNTQTHTI